MLTNHNPLTINSKASSDDCYHDALHRVGCAQAVVGAIAGNHESVDRAPMSEDEHGALVAADILLRDAAHLIDEGLLVQHRERKRRIDG